MSNIAKVNNQREVQNYIIALKEVVDVINTERVKDGAKNIQHSKAVKIVEELAKEPSFGEVAKIDTLNLNGVKVKTLNLTKKQALAVGAKLDNKRLMLVINKLEELTTAKLLTVADQIQLLAQNYIETNMRLDKLEKTKRIANWQEKALHDAKNQKVYSLAKDDKELASKLHRKIWSLFKQKFYLPRYNELPAVKFQEGIDFINSLTLLNML